MSKESCKWRRKTFLKARSIHSCGVGEDGDRKERGSKLKGYRSKIHM
jgi:hypothetical protein